MISVLGLDSGKAFKRTLDTGQELPESTIWIDLLHPTEEERAAIAGIVGSGYLLHTRNPRHSGWGCGNIRHLA